MFSDVVERKGAFLDKKNFDLKKAQNLHFSKRVHGFCQKLKMFSSFVLLQNGSRKKNEKKPFLTMKSMDLKQIFKICIFLELVHGF